LKRENGTEKPGATIDRTSRERRLPVQDPRRCTRLAIASLVVVAIACSKNKDEPPTQTEERIHQLEQQVEQEKLTTQAAVESYVPKLQGRIDDLAAPAADILRQLPGVADVEVLVVVPKPTHRIVHLRDWHLVPRELHALDLRQAAGRELTDEEIDMLHSEHLLEVELVQLEQAAVLKCLAKHHGLRRVLCEGLTAQGVAGYKAKVDALRELDHRLPDLRRQLRELSPEKRADVEKEVDGLDNEQRRGLVELGAPARLLLGGELQGVLPLDDEDALRQSKPVTPDGRIKEDHDKVRAREDAMVKLALKSGPLFSAHPRRGPRPFCKHSPYDQRSRIYQGDNNTLQGIRWPVGRPVHIGSSSRGHL